MKTRLGRLFWHLYGRFVWSKHEPPWREKQIEDIVYAIQGQRMSSTDCVLDAGCGTGEHALALADAGFDVIGIDYAQGMLYHAKQKIPLALEDQLLFYQMSLDEPLPFGDGAFEHVINISVLQATADPRFTLQELHRVLVDGGTLYLLHVPKPDYANWSLREMITDRINHSEDMGLFSKGLIAAKSFAERMDPTRYWTYDEVMEMMETAGFTLIEAKEEPVIIAHGRKASPEDANT